MDLPKLKEMLSEVQNNENKLRDQFRIELTALKDSSYCFSAHCWRSDMIISRVAG